MDIPIIGQPKPPNPERMALLQQRAQMLAMRDQITTFAADPYLKGEKMLRIPTGMVNAQQQMVVAVMTPTEALEAVDLAELDAQVAANAEQIRLLDAGIVVPTLVPPGQ